MPAILPRQLTPDVCVIGGGPAGVAAAIRLVQLQHTVTLVEKSAFPRRQAAESLAPSILPLLEILGVRDKVENAGFLRSPGALIRWASAEVERRATAGEAGFQVERACFDNLLLASARQAGVRVIQPARAVQFEKTSQADWQVQIRGDSGRAEIRARALVFAGGRNAFSGGPRLIDSPATLALAGCWHNAVFPGSETRVEAGSNEWYWGSPLASGAFHATVFLDPSRFRKQIQANGSKEEIYRALLQQSGLFKQCLPGRLIGSVRAYDATSYSNREIVTPNSIKVGEAAFAIDPLSSQGVVAAIGSGLHAATVLHTIFNRPHATDLALRFYENRIRQSVLLNRRAASRFYTDAGASRPSDFWRARISPVAESADPPRVQAAHRVVLSHDVRFDQVPVVAGEFIGSAVGIFSPRLTEPAVFLNRIPLVPLLAAVNGQETASRLLEIWQRKIPPATASAILSWLLRNEILVRAA